MNKLLVWVARLAGVGGAALIAAAVLSRLAGAFWLAGLQVGTLLQAGMAITLLGCLAYLAALVEQPRR